MAPHQSPPLSCKLPRLSWKPPLPNWMELLAGLYVSTSHIQLAHRDSCIAFPIAPFIVLYGMCCVVMTRMLQILQVVHASLQVLYTPVYSVIAPARRWRFHQVVKCLTWVE